MIYQTVLTQLDKDTRESVKGALTVIGLSGILEAQVQAELIQLANKVSGAKDEAEALACLRSYGIRKCVLDELIHLCKTEGMK